MQKIRLLIVDDHTLVRDGLVSILNLENDILIVGVASSGREALEIVKKVEVDVVLMDIIMPEMNGLETTLLIKEYNSSVEVVLLSMEVNEKFVAEGIKQGAKGYLPKDISRAELVESIKTVHAGEKYFAKEISDLIFNGFYIKSQNEELPEKPNQAISTREREILILIAEGKSAHEIAEKLLISVKTVDAHRHNLLKKLRLKGTVDLVRYALKNGLVSIT